MFTNLAILVASHCSSNGVYKPTYNWGASHCISIVTIIAIYLLISCRRQRQASGPKNGACYGLSFRASEAYGQRFR